MGWQVIIGPSAQSDLADIVRYIGRHNSDSRTFAKLSAVLIGLSTGCSVSTNGFRLSASGTEHGDFPTSPPDSDSCSAPLDLNLR
jgi:hypothetical protein